MQFSITTDLALEARELSSANAGEIEGVSEEQGEYDGITVHRIEILDERGEETLGKMRGKYITIELSPEFDSEDEFERCVSVVGREVARLFGENMSGTVLVAGLGNMGVTPDSLGPKTVENIMVTRHIRDELSEFMGGEMLRPVAAISPGVLGQTGVESAEIVRGVVESIRPSAVVVVDALAARRLSRLAATVQISDTGINPGSGVGNHRTELSSRTLGVPVISVGVPMVVHAATLAADLIQRAVGLSGGDSEVMNCLGRLDGEQMGQVLREAMDPFSDGLYVTPKNVDSLVASASRLVGYSINHALFTNISISDMRDFLV